MTESRRAAALAAMCTALTVLVFLPALHFPFLNWDDGVNIVSNPNLHLTPSGLAWMWTGSLLGHWQPLTWMSFALDRAVWGDGPSGFHLTNLLIHAASAALLFLLARRLLRSDAAAAFSSLFWALHPLRVESVAWVTERRDVLSGALVLAALLSYVRGAQESIPHRGLNWRRTALAFGAAAMTAKVFAIVLPGVLLIFDARLRGRPRWKEKMPWAVPVAIALAFNLDAQSSVGASVSLGGFGVRARLSQSVYGLAFYAWKTLCPTGLGPLYERSLLLEPAPFVLAGLAVLIAAVLLWRGRRRFPWLAQAALAYILFVLPALGLFKSGRMTAADRYSYLPSLPLSLLAGAAFARFADRRWTKTVFALPLAAFAALTLRQLPVWGSDEALWTRACAVSPLSYFARLKLADAEDAAGRPGEAAASRAEAARLHAEVFDRAAAIYAMRGDADAAAAALARKKDGLSALTSTR